MMIIIISWYFTNFDNNENFSGEQKLSQDGLITSYTSSPTWIIDPIDGTMNFVHSNPLVCTSVGLTINKKLVAGLWTQLYLTSSSSLYHYHHHHNYRHQDHNFRCDQLPSCGSMLHSSARQGSFLQWKEVKNQRMQRSFKGLFGICVSWHPFFLVFLHQSLET